MYQSREDRMFILENTLMVLQRGSYVKDGRTVNLFLTSREMEQCQVVLPDEAHEIAETEIGNNPDIAEKCRFSCVNEDSFTAAIKMIPTAIKKNSANEKAEPLVLNFANPVHIGGGVRNGARAQEEDLCRQSSLLLSLESREAFKYYKYNRGLQGKMGSDAFILSPKVEIIKDRNGDFLESPSIVAAITCAAPYLKFGMGRMTMPEYCDMMLLRIKGLLKFAAQSGYTRLVLGAWGCGAFGNDPKTMSDLFHKAFQEINPDGLFREVCFAVLDTSYDKHIFREFARNFGK